MEIIKAGRYITPVIKAQMVCYHGILQVAKHIDELFQSIEKDKPGIFESVAFRLNPFNDGYELRVKATINSEEVEQMGLFTQTILLEYLRFTVSFQPDSFFNDNYWEGRPCILKGCMIPRKDYSVFTDFKVSDSRELKKAKEKFITMNRERLAYIRRAVNVNKR